MKSKILTLTGNAIPADLQQIPQPPRKLFAVGNIDALDKVPRLSVVGSRKVSPYGRQVTESLVSDLAGRGVVIVSGLALGVDSIAHETAVKAGVTTIAVLPSGLDRIYPASHHDLARKIVESGGLLISEYPIDTPAYKDHFIARNRLVSGLGQAVLITEAAKRSGTLHTANFALEQGKSVLAVPGNITSPGSEGTNNLIKSGALPVTGPEDIAFALGLNPDKKHQKSLFGDNAEETILLELMASGITDTDQLLATSGLSPAFLNQTLTMLEINGKIRPTGAGHWSIK